MSDDSVTSLPSQRREREQHVLYHQQRNEMHAAGSSHFANAQAPKTATITQKNWDLLLASLRTIKKTRRTSTCLSTTKQACPSDLN